VSAILVFGGRGEQKGHSRVWEMGKSREAFREGFLFVWRRDEFFFLATVHLAGPMTEPEKKTCNPRGSPWPWTRVQKTTTGKRCRAQRPSRAAAVDVTVEQRGSL